jgi:DNA-binding transcriptional LysR family regulator
MTFDQLQQFLMVAKLNSFTRAAEALYVSHSTISRNVSLLEQSLGVTLIIRDTRSVTLTHAGQLLYERGTKLMQYRDTLIHEVQMAGKGATGILKVASINLYNDLLFSTFRAFSEANPDITLNFHQFDLAHIVQEILYDQADIGITFSYALGGEKSQFQTIPIADESFCILASNNFSSEKLQTFALTGHIDVPVLFINDLSYDFVEHLTDARWGEPAVPSARQSVDSLESMLLQIRAGAGVSLLPESVATQYRSGCKLVKLEGSDTSYQVVLFYKRGNENPVLPMFIQKYTLMRSQAAEHSAF